MHVTTEQGVGPLMIVGCNGHNKCVNILIEKGADVNAVHKKGRTVLSIIAGCGEDSCLQSLIKAGGDVNTPGKHDGTTALMLAAFYGRE